MALPAPNEIKKQTVVVERKTLTPEQVNNWMNYHGFSVKEFSDLLGVTPQAVKLWKSGQREFNETNSRLLQLFDKYPKLMKEF